MFDRIKSAAISVGSFVKKNVGKVAAAAAAFFACTAESLAEGNAVTLPETGVDVGQYATTCISSIGSVIAICVGGYFAFKLVKIGIKWAGSLLSRG